MGKGASRVRRRTKELIEPLYTYFPNVVSLHVQFNIGTSGWNLLINYVVFILLTTH